MKSGILITGGSGYLAKGLVKPLLEGGADRICLYSRGEYAQARMRAEFKDDPRLRWFIGDVRDRDRLEWAMESVQHVIHAAALKRIETGAYNPGEMAKTNVDGTVNVIEAARRAKVQKVLLVSSDKAFEPVSPYGQTKAIAESLFFAANNHSPYGPRFAVVRYGNVWASTGSLVPTWRSILNSSDTVPVTSPDATRFFMWRDEAAALVLDTLMGMVGGELVVPVLPAYRVGDVAEAMGAKMDIRGLPRFEKLHESMDAEKSSDVARRMSVDELREALKRA